MAQNLVLNILAKDKTKQAFNGVRAGLSNLRSAVFSVQGAIIGIGGGLAIKSILNVGSTVEQLRLRFAFLFKGVKEGDKAFQGLIDFAGKVPFSLDEISSASGSLAVVAKDADELQKILKITGNVASVTGLDFRTTAEQIQSIIDSQMPREEKRHRAQWIFDNTLDQDTIAPRVNSLHQVFLDRSKQNIKE